MPEAWVLFGEVANPCSLWLVPDRGAMGDVKVVRKVVKLEEKLAMLCCEEEQDLTIGKVVAVRHESKMVRAKVEGVNVDGEVQLFLLDWGVTRVRSGREAMKIPESVRLPQRCLSHRINLSPGAAFGNKKLLQDLVKECAGGKLSEQAVLPGGDVTGVLAVKLTTCSALLRRYFFSIFNYIAVPNIRYPAALQGVDLSSVCVNSLLSATSQHKHLESKALSRDGSNLDPFVQTRERSMSTTIEPLQHAKKLTGTMGQTGSPSSRTLHLAGFDGDDMPEPAMFKLPKPLLASVSSAIKQDDKVETDSDNESMISIQESLRSNGSLEVETLLATGNVGLGSTRVAVPLQQQQQVDLSKQLDGSLKTVVVEPSAPLHSHLVHTPPGSRALVQLSKVSALPWPSTLQTFLHRQGVTEARALQTTMWPAVSKLQSLLVVAPSSIRSPVSSWAEGKTLGWLLPVLAILAEPPATPSIGPQPRLVVICPGLQLVSFIADLINQVAIGSKIPLKVVEDAAGLSEVEASMFINGIDVLVTTPARLLDRMEEEETPVTGLQR